MRGFLTPTVGRTPAPRGFAQVLAMGHIEYGAGRGCSRGTGTGETRVRGTPGPHARSWGSRASPDPPQRGGETCRIRATECGLTLHHYRIDSGGRRDHGGPQHHAIPFGLKNRSACCPARRWGARTALTGFTGQPPKTRHSHLVSRAIFAAAPVSSSAGRRIFPRAGWDRNMRRPHSLQQA